MSACGISWKPPRPRSESGACPLSRTTGDSAAIATYSAVSVLANPGPAVTRATPGSPVNLPHASAACTAAASCRKWTRSVPASRAASNTGMIWLPDSVKIRPTPSADRVLTSRSAPRNRASFISKSLARALSRNDERRSSQSRVDRDSV